MKPLFLALFLIPLFIGCEKQGIKKVETDNSEFNVTLLFIVDSCKVYRFKDGANYRYFVTSQGWLCMVTVYQTVRQLLTFQKKLKQYQDSSTIPFITK